MYFEILRSEASSAVAPLTADVLGRWELARVSGIVTSQVMDNNNNNNNINNNNNQSLIYAHIYNRRC